MLTGTSAYTNNAGTSDWAKSQLLGDYQIWKEAEYLALLAMEFIPGRAGNKNVGSKTSKVTGQAKLSPTTKGEGAALKRTFDVGGTKVEINSGHGYRESGHRTGNSRNVGTMDEIESAIVKDVGVAKQAGVTFPNVPKTIERNVQVNGHAVGYTVTQYEGLIRVSTYYPK